MTTFELNGEEYIELNKLLKLLNFVESGADAKLRIDNGEVTVNDKTELRRRNKLRAGDKVCFAGQTVVIV